MELPNKNGFPAARDISERHYVEPGKGCYHVTRAVNARGVLSPPSNEARVRIPR